MPLSSSFVFVTCQVGAERALKQEIARVSPALRPAFSRPGFVTFKADAPVAIDALPTLVLGRTAALSLGHGRTRDVHTRVAELTRTHTFARAHVWERDRVSPAEQERAGTAQPAADALAVDLKPLAPSLNTDARVGDLVLDIVGTDDDTWYFGAHVHRARTAAAPGADPRLAVPADAPSRAWLKIEQAARAFDLPIARGDRVIEVGAAPGGVTHALLTRGCDVIAVDPAEMDPRLVALGGARFTHVKAPIADVEGVDAEVQWIVLDVNISPFAALRQIEELVRAHADTLVGVVLTLKLGAWHMAARIPHLVSLVKKLAPKEHPFVAVHATQLPANKVEICVAAWTARGARSG